MSSHSYYLTYELWPYQGITQANCGPRTTTVDLKTSEFSEAYEKAQLVRATAENNEVVWVCHIRELRFGGPSK